MDAILDKAKAVAALVGAVATALLGLYGPDTTLGQTLTVIVAVATAVATYAVPNKKRTKDDAGEVGVVGAVIIVVAVVVVLFLLGFIRR